jgi:hypothetical protein
VFKIYHIFLLYAPVFFIHLFREWANFRFELLETGPSGLLMVLKTSVNDAGMKSQLLGNQLNTKRGRRGYA